MPSVGKKESKILHAIARKKMKDFKDTPLVQQATTEIQQIKAGPLDKYDTEKELETDILAYIEKQKTENKPLTITGLAISLGIDRGTLLRWTQKEKYGPIINKYKQVLLSQVEEALTDKAKFTPGQIFYLKNNYKQDYSDKIEVEHSGQVSLVELNRRAMALDECDIVEGEVVEDIAQEEAQARAEAQA